MKIKKNFITLEVTKITIGKNDQVYLTIHHPKAKNWPSLVFDKSDFDEIGYAKVMHVSIKKRGVLHGKGSNKQS